MPFLKVNNKSLHYTDTKPAGPDTRATIVFVHGLGSTQNYFGPILGHLTDGGYRCVAFDNYGAGRSTMLEGGEGQGEEHSIESMGRDVLGVMDGLEVCVCVCLSVCLCERERGALGGVWLID